MGKNVDAAIEVLSQIAPEPLTASKGISLKPDVKPLRDLTLREKFYFPVGFSDPKDIVTELLSAEDACRTFIPTSNTYLSSFAEEAYFFAKRGTGSAEMLGQLQQYRNVGDPKGQVTTTALLDHYLAKVGEMDPVGKKKIVSDAVLKAANMMDTTREQGQRGDWSNIHRHIVTDVSGKLLVLARHGGDLNQAVLTAKTDSMTLRNAVLMSVAGKPMSYTAAQKAIDAFQSPNNPDKRLGDSMLFLLPALMSANAVPKTEIHYQTFNGNISTKDPVTLSLIGDSSGKAMDNLIASGAKPNARELFMVALLGRNDKMMTHLKGLGLDINDKDAKGRNALDVILEANLDEHRNKGSVHYYLDDYKKIIERFRDAGGNADAAISVFTAVVNKDMQDTLAASQGRLLKQMSEEKDKATDFARKMKFDEPSLERK